ncbi:MAG: hypothetical protein JWQ63_1798 [Mucilaginibacter sp.]|jgi:hypothetical protein|nr:hypothetical protein [Mucilaginibacter sp.]
MEAKPEIPKNVILTELLEIKNAKGSVAFMGYIGPDPDNKHEFISLYQDIFDLSKWLEIKKSDIIYFTPVPESVLPFGGTILWVPKSSIIKFESIKCEEAEFDKYTEEGLRAGSLGLVMGQATSIKALRRPICNPL